ncbi:MAG: cysteine--tRNA ligase [Sedimentisphaerales bacterium]|nr:cysteine--tRNA ligase [Sedimentisphaerales bacterium]
MGLQLYNSLTRKKEEFKPVSDGRVGIYVCGPTVYGHAHLGHAKSYVSFDILVRYMRYLGYNVTYVQNITDVGHLTDDADQGEDKIAKAAAKVHKHPMELAELYTRSYFEDMDKLNCVRPDISPRASGHIVEQIELVKTLIEKGFAYEVNGSVYFDVSKFAEYGKLSGRNVEDMLAGARVEVSAEKKHPADFALWKKAETNHIMQWPSPWGQGFPGWHLECSVMSTKYLGQPFDIHGGGMENQFPHHECEIAQAEAARGVQFVKYWLHNNMVTVDGQKMGKSLNNFITLKQVFTDSAEPKHERLSRKYDALAVRQLILNSHYRSTLDFSDEALHAAQSGYDRIKEIVKILRKRIERIESGAQTQTSTNSQKEVNDNLKNITEKFESAMNDDLNTSVALSVIFHLVDITKATLIDPTLDKNTLMAINEKFSQLGGECLGIIKKDYGKDVIDTGMISDLIKTLIEQRSAARAKMDFVASDVIRMKLDALGIILEDKPGGITTWRLK